MTDSFDPTKETIINIQHLSKWEGTAGAIIHINFPTQAELMGSFLKVQEFYESPEFAGKSFTRAEFEAWYMKSRGASTFTYLEDWTGCNIPGRVVSAFLVKPGFAAESEQEFAFNKLLVDIAADNGDNFALIGTFGATQDALRHEFAHALWALDKDYRSVAQAALAKVPQPIREDITRMLSAKGYGPAVLEDEMHAYTMDDTYGLIHMAHAAGYHIHHPELFAAGEKILAVYTYIAERYGLKT